MVKVNNNEDQLYVGRTTNWRSRQKGGTGSPRAETLGRHPISQSELSGHELASSGKLGQPWGMHRHKHHKPQVPGIKDPDTVCF